MKEGLLCYLELGSASEQGKDQFAIKGKNPFRHRNSMFVKLRSEEEVGSSFLGLVSAHANRWLLLVDLISKKLNNHTAPCNSPISTLVVWAGRRSWLTWPAACLLHRGGIYYLQFSSFP